MQVSNLLAGNFNNVGIILKSFMSEWWGILLGVVAAASGLIAIIAGLKYLWAVKEGDENKVKKAREFVVGIIVAIVIMVVGAALIPVIIAGFISWFENDASDYIDAVQLIVKML